MNTRKSYLLWLNVLLLLITGISSCDSDDDMTGTEDNDSTFHVKYYDQDPDLYKRQGYWYRDSFIEMTPQKESPYTLLVIWDSDKGKKALDYIVSENAGEEILRTIIGSTGINAALIRCQKYFTCPYLFVSSSYKTTQLYHDDDYIRVSCRISVAMKSGKNPEVIEYDYADILKLDREQYKAHPNWTPIFNCKLNTSCEVLQLAEEINSRDDVEWAEAEMFIPAHLATQ